MVFTAAAGTVQLEPANVMQDQTPKASTKHDKREKCTQESGSTQLRETEATASAAKWTRDSIATTAANTSLIPFTNQLGTTVI